MFKFRWFNTTAEREVVVLDNYDFGVDIEAQQLYIGDGATMGGVPVSTNRVAPPESAAVVLYGLDDGGNPPLPGTVLQAEIDTLTASGIDPNRIVWFSIGAQATGTATVALLAGAFAPVAGTLGVVGTRVGSIPLVSGSFTPSAGALGATGRQTGALALVSGVFTPAAGSLNVAAGASILLVAGAFAPSAGGLTVAGAQTGTIALVPGSFTPSTSTLCVAAGASIALVPGAFTPTTAGLDISGVQSGSIALAAGSVTAAMGVLGLTGSQSGVISVASGVFTPALGSTGLTGGQSGSIALVTGAITPSAGSLGVTATSGALSLVPANPSFAAAITTASVSGVNTLGGASTVTGQAVSTAQWGTLAYQASGWDSGTTDTINSNPSGLVERIAYALNGSSYVAHMSAYVGVSDDGAGGGMNVAGNKAELSFRIDKGSGVWPTGSSLLTYDMRVLGGSAGGQVDVRVQLYNSSGTRINSTSKELYGLFGNTRSEGVAFTTTTFTPTDNTDYIGKALDLGTHINTSGNYSGGTLSTLDHIVVTFRCWGSGSIYLGNFR